MIIGDDNAFRVDNKSTAQRRDFLTGRLTAATPLVEKLFEKAVKRRLAGTARAALLDFLRGRYIDHGRGQAFGQIGKAIYRSCHGRTDRQWRNHERENNEKARERLFQH